MCGTEFRFQGTEMLKVAQLLLLANSIFQSNILLSLFRILLGT